MCIPPSSIMELSGYLLLILSGSSCAKMKVQSKCVLSNKYENSVTILIEHFCSKVYLLVKPYYSKSTKGINAPFELPFHLHVKVFSCARQTYYIMTLKFHIIINSYSLIIQMYTPIFDYGPT